MSDAAFLVPELEGICLFFGLTKLRNLHITVTMDQIEELAKVLRGSPALTELYVGVMASSADMADEAYMQLECLTRIRVKMRNL